MLIGSKGAPLPAVVVHKVTRSWLPVKDPAPWFPDCFPTIESFELWLSSWSPSKDPDVTFCTDCTPTRRDAMVSQGRCHFPKTTFDMDDDDWTRGNRA